MSEELTQEDKELVEVVKKDWLAKLENPINKVAATEAVKKFYRRADLAEPEVIFCTSPKDAQRVANEYATEKHGLEEQYWPFSVYGNVSDFGWCSFYDFFVRKGVLEDERFTEFLEISDSGIYDMIQTDLYCFIVPMPKFIKRDEENRLHCDGGASVEWEDGYKVFFLHGTQVSEELATTPATQLSLDMYNELKDNADVRTEFVRKFGIDRMTDMGKVIDTWQNYENKAWYAESEYELIDMNCLFDSIDYAPHLKMKHLTMGIFCVEPVSPECRTIEDALNDRIEEDLDGHEITDIK